MYSLESPHRGESNEYTQHTIIEYKIENTSPNYRRLLPDPAPWLTLSGSSYPSPEETSKRCSRDRSSTVYVKTAIIHIALDNIFPVATENQRSVLLLTWYQENSALFLVSHGNGEKKKKKKKHTKKQQQKKHFVIKMFLLFQLRHCILTLAATVHKDVTRVWKFDLQFHNPTPQT